MLRPKIHVCLVHNTAIANIAPALAPEFKPEEVILVFSNSKRAQADNLAAVLKPTGIRISEWVIEDNRQIEHIRDSILNLLVSREREDLALNASGGTRPMSMAAYEIFQEFNKPIFYVHPETDDISWLHQRNLPQFNCANRIKLPAFLRAYGAEVTQIGERRGVPENLRILTQTLVQNAEILAKPLAALNWLAQRAESNLVSPPLNESQQQWQELQALITLLVKEGLLAYQNNRLYFEDEEKRFFVNGGWLENHVFSVIYGLRKNIPTIQDIGRSIEIVRTFKGEVKNEIDVAFLANNHLYIIECKTKRFGYTDQTETPGAEILFKLDTLKWLLGGTNTKTMLVSYHPLSPWDKQRADDLEIATNTAQYLPNLEKDLRRWITD